MVFSLVACCPPFSLFGALLGVLAIKRIGESNGSLRGMRLAKTAAIVGMTLGVAGLVVWWRFEKSMEQWRSDTSIKRVESFVRAAQDADAAAAKATWVMSRSATISESQAIDFGRITRERYGSFRAFHIALVSGTPGILSSSLEIAGTFSFEGGDRPGSATLIATATANWNQPTLLLSRIAIDDAELGDVVLPPGIGTTGVSPPPTSATSQPAP